MNLQILTSRIAMFFSMLCLSITNALADIPGVESNAAGVGADGGLFAFSSGWVQDAILFAVPACLGLIFIWMIWELWSKINEQRQAKEPQWNGVLAFGGASVVYFIVATFIAVAVQNLWV